MEAEQHCPIRIEDLPKVVVGGTRLGLAEKRLVPLEAGWNVADADDRPCAFHCVSSSQSGGKVELPGHAKTIVQPSKPTAEAVVVQWHEDLAAVREPGKYPVQFFCAIEVDKGGAGRGEREVMLHRTVGAHELSAAKREPRDLDRASRAALAGAVTIGAHDTRFRERSDIEVHRGLCDATLEHQKRFGRCHRTPH